MTTIGLLYLIATKWHKDSLDLEITTKADWLRNWNNYYLYVLYIVYCILYNVYCILYIVYFTLYIVLYILLNCIYGVNWREYWTGGNTGHLLITPPGQHLQCNQFEIVPSKVCLDISASFKIWNYEIEWKFSKKTPPGMKNACLKMVWYKNRDFREFDGLDKKFGDELYFLYKIPHHYCLFRPHLNSRWLFLVLPRPMHEKGIKCHKCIMKFELFGIIGLLSHYFTTSHECFWWF